MPSGIYKHKKGYKRPPFSNEWLNKIRVAAIGHIPWNKGKHYSEEFKKKMSEIRKGQIPWNKGLKDSCPHTEEWKKKISIIHKKNGLTPPSWKGKKRSPESIEKSAIHRRGIKRPEFSGANNYLWKGGITPLHIIIRTSFENKNWIRNIFKRDDYTCQECFVRGGKLEAHHEKAFSIILKEFLQKYSQFSPIEDKETLARLAITYEPFWDITNGKTLCNDCHNKTKITINGAQAN